MIHNDHLRGQIPAKPRGRHARVNTDDEIREIIRAMTAANIYAACASARQAPYSFVGSDVRFVAIRRQMVKLEYFRLAPRIHTGGYQSQQAAAAMTGAAIDALTKEAAKDKPEPEEPAIPRGVFAPLVAEHFRAWRRITEQKRKGARA